MTKDQKNILESIATLSEVTQSMTDAGPEILRLHPREMHTALVAVRDKLALLQEYTMCVFAAEKGPLDKNDFLWVLQRVQVAAGLSKRLGRMKVPGGGEGLSSAAFGMSALNCELHETLDFLLERTDEKQDAG